MPLPRATAYSMCIAGVLIDAPRRGMVHSAFASAANLVFPGDVIISLNTNAQPSHSSPHLTPFPGMPNGIQVDRFPFAALQPGMPVLLGAARLIIDAIDCSLDLSCCAQWDARIARPTNLDVDVVRKNAAWLAREYSAGTDHYKKPGHPQGDVPTLSGHQGRDIPLRVSWPHACATTCGSSITEMARALCGRGRGLTPAGDDMLAGWMAIKWLLYGPSSIPTKCERMGDHKGSHSQEDRGKRTGDHKGPTPAPTIPRYPAHPFSLIAACEEIMAVARQQTHILSRCWLGYATQGYVALPVRALLAAMTENDERQLAAAAQVVASMGATSGRDLMRGMVMGV